MSKDEWESTTEEGIQYWLHESLGNVVKVGQGFVSIKPVAVKLGPFETLEEAKNALLLNQQALEDLITTFNETLVNK